MTTSPSATDRPRDPVCGMAVRIEAANEDGLVADHDSHTYYFCRQGCLDQFRADPVRYVTSHHHAESEPAPAAAIEIDAGMRLWYESCSCCLSDAHPEVKAALDAERQAKAQGPVGGRNLRGRRRQGCHRIGRAIVRGERGPCPARQ